MSDTVGRALIRVGKTLGVYALVAGLTWLAVPSIQRVFLLPRLFRPLVAAMLIFGVPMAAAIAWRYPRLGSDDSEEG
ncbi:MAG TPA: hypothetical protein VLA36_09485 [Longimicrobiales bacterium]|nr:hypothetical protein [Longimicrobiales bacterium]